MINKFKLPTEIIYCPMCGTGYALFKDCAPDIPLLHRVCITCRSPIEVSNPFYIEEVEYVCVDSCDGDSRLPSCP